jgi:uncharacterized protein YejL (UPF0352 family)
MNEDMKLLSRTSTKLASLAVFIILAAAAGAVAQDPRIHTNQLDALAAKASQTVDVNLDERLMQLGAKFLSDKDDEVKIKQLINGLKGIYVKSFEFETEGQYSEADLEGIRSQLRNPAWNKIVNVSSKKEGSVEVYLMQLGNQITGLAVLAIDPKEVTVVNIVGPVDLEKLSDLEGNFGVPELGIERPKTKRKN